MLFVVLFYLFNLKKLERFGKMWYIERVAYRYVYYYTCRNWRKYLFFTILGGLLVCRLTTANKPFPL